MEKSLLLIDGNSIINRAYYGLAGRAPMKSPDGTPTGALLGFLNIYLRFSEETNPDYVCVCFDLKGPTFRHKQFEQYKAQRKPMPDDLATQIPILKEILDAIGMPRIELEGYEADDLIGSISKFAVNQNLKTLILTGDKDDLQLVDENINVIMPITTKGQTDIIYYDENKVFEKFKITPKQFVDLKAIMGDPSDNIPGVKGVGEKGATNLLVEYNDLDNIYNNLEELPKGISDKLENSKEIAYISKELATIKCDLPVESYFDDILNSKIDFNEGYQIFNRLGFNSIIKRMDVSVPDHIVKQKQELSNQINKKDIITIKVEDISKYINLENLYKLDISKLFKEKVDINSITKNEIRNIVKETSALSNECFTDRLSEIIEFEDVGYIVIYSIDEKRILIDSNQETFFVVEITELNELVNYLISNKIRIIGFGLKDLLTKRKVNAYKLLLFDILVAGYILNQYEGNVSIHKLASMCLGEDFVLPEIFESEKSLKQQSLFDEEKNDSNVEEDLILAKTNISLIKDIAKMQFDEICESGLFLLAINVEMPLVGILAQMQSKGIKVDEQILNDFNNEISKKIIVLEENIHEIAGEKFNINSPKQLAIILFEKLSLPTGKKGQTGYSTNIEVLEKLKDKHPIIDNIIAYRQLTKLKSTFIEGLMNSINKNDGRVHTTFHQTLTTTGRLSSSNPNLQNIPIKLEEGREIRKAFVSEKGYSLIDADYSQIELRLLASLCKDEAMIEAFINGDDIHLNTAMEMFDMPKEMITPGMRSMAKTINFSIVYGIGEYSLSMDLGISMKEAKKYIEEYHKKYPKVKPYFNNLIKDAHTSGYVETLFKRRRYINELKSANRNIVSFGERAAMNTPVQGTAADIMKIAMVITYNRLKKEQIDADLILQVHDELIIETKNNNAKKVSDILQSSMEQSIKLCVPLVAQASIKKNWYE